MAMQQPDVSANKRGDGAVFTTSGTDRLRGSDRIKGERVKDRFELDKAKTANVPK
jgi:hypothetical protein